MFTSLYFHSRAPISTPSLCIQLPLADLFMSVIISKVELMTSPPKPGLLFVCLKAASLFTLLQMGHVGVVLVS